MTDDAAESTLLNPGEKYRPDATFDLTKKLAWALLEDEVSRRVKTSHGWKEPGSTTNELMLARAVFYGAPERPYYLAEYDAEKTGRSYLDYDGFYSSDLPSTRFRSSVSGNPSSPDQPMSSIGP